MRVLIAQLFRRTADKLDPKSTHVTYECVSPDMRVMRAEAALQHARWSMAQR